MNLKIKLLGIVSLLLLFTAVNFAQEMTEEQWQSEMTSYKNKKAALESESNALKTDIDNLKAMNLRILKNALTNYIRLLAQLEMM